MTKKTPIILGTFFPVQASFRSSLPAWTQGGLMWGIVHPGMANTLHASVGGITHIQWNSLALSGIYTSIICKL